MCSDRRCKAWHCQCCTPAAGHGATNFENHPALLKFRRLGGDARELVRKKIHQKKYRFIEKLRSGQCVRLGPETQHVYEPPQDTTLLQDFEKEFAGKYTFFVANSCDLPDVDRGSAMSLWLRMHPPSGGLHGIGSAATCIRSKTALLTYNGPWGRTSPPPLLSGVEEIAAWMRVQPWFASMQAEVLQMLTKIQDASYISQWVFSFELCKRTVEPGFARVHLHVWISVNHPIKTELLSFRDTLPFFDLFAMLKYGSASRSSQASFGGAFYLSVDKIGGVHWQGTIQPFVHYQVKDCWVTNLYSGDKITAEVAEVLYLEAVVRCEMNIRQLKFAQQRKLELGILHAQKKTEDAISSGQKQWRCNPEVDKWLSQYESTLGRYLFLVLDGKSKTGKTQYAKSLVGRDEAFYCDCSAGIPDLRSFLWSKHKLILLDEIDPAIAIGLKKLLQAGNDVCKLGMSPTGQHAYNIYAHRTKIVCCTNTWRTGLMGLPAVDREWLVQNSVVIDVDRTLWVD